MTNPSSLRALDILLAEDNPDHAELMLETLGDFNPKNRITHKLNGEEILRHLDSTLERHQPLPDLILMDIKMPRMSGIETLTAIKQNDSLKHIPVVMVTTSSNEQEVSLCYRCGASSYVTKPLSYNEFVEKVASLNGYWGYTSYTPHA